MAEFSYEYGKEYLIWWHQFNLFETENISEAFCNLQTQKQQNPIIDGEIITAL